MNGVNDDMKKKATLFKMGLIIGIVTLVIGILVVLTLTNARVISWSEFRTWSWGILQQLLQQFGQLISRN